MFTLSDLFGLFYICNKRSHFQTHCSPTDLGQGLVSQLSQRDRALSPFRIFKRKPLYLTISPSSRFMWY